MSWLLPRLLLALLAVAAGAAAGHLAGAALQSAELGAVLGAALATALVVLRDAVRARRLLRWLRGDGGVDAPRDAGFWGELGFRTERLLREAERATAAEQQRLAGFLRGIEASPNGVLLLDAADQISWCNAAAAEQLRLDARRDVGQPITNLVRAPTFVAHLQGQDWSDPLVLAGADGLGTLSVVVRPFGQRQKLVLTQDITERQRADAMRRDFVANVSHEIRTPLTVLAGFVETMASLPLDDAERGRMLGLMQQQAARMRTLVDDLLILAQLEGSPRPPADRWLALAPLVERVAADARTLSAGRHQVSVGALPALELAGQEAELVSAVANLATNAVRYTAEGGRIDIDWLARPDGGGAIEVRDNGIGIAREHQPRLTERFYRVDGSRSRATGGTGLGLSIVKHVMQRHGGTLEIDSQPGRGSRFRLCLPASRVREPGPASAAGDLQADHPASDGHRVAMRPRAP